MAAPRNRALERPTHQDILKVLIELDYPASSGGTCYGIAVMGMQAALAGDLQKYDDRLSNMTDCLAKFGGPINLANNIKDIEVIRIKTIEKYRIDLLTQLAQIQGLNDKDMSDYTNMAD